MRVRLTAALIGALIVIGGGALAAPKAPAPQKVEVINTVQTSEVAKPEKPDPTTVPCDPAADMRTSDLCAQWKAADAARDGANWTLWAFIIGTIINLGTLVFVGLTFRETRKSTKAATQSADASEISAKAAVDAAVGAGELLKADRAWMTTVTPEVSCFVAGDGAKVLGAEIKINLKWTNTGRSPALNFRSSTEVGWMEGPDQTHIENPRPEKTSAGLSLGVGAVYAPAFGVIKKEDAVRFAAGEIDFYVYSSCEYEDVFHPGTIRRSAAYFRLTALKDKVRHGRYLMETHLRPIGPQNYAL